MGIRQCVCVHVAFPVTMIYRCMAGSMFRDLSGRHTHNPFFVQRLSLWKFVRLPQLLALPWLRKDCSTCCSHDVAEHQPPLNSNAVQWCWWRGGGCIGRAHVCVCDNVVALH